jgi:hypothetical protein
MEKALLSSQATSTNRIRKLEEQVASISAELHRMHQQLNSTPGPNKPTGTNPKRGRSTAYPSNQCTYIPATPCPQKPTNENLNWAKRLTAGTDQQEEQFTTIARKKNKPVPITIIPKALPGVEREVIITCETQFANIDRAKFADYALNRFNHAIRHSADITQLPFILARINSNNKLVLTTNPTTPATAYKPYMQILANEIKSLKPTEGYINTRWSKFLVHNIPTNATLPAVKANIESTYPSLSLTQDPRWLVPTERRLNKSSSTIVVSLVGAIDLEHLGTTSLAICNHMCCITEYFSWTPSSHCRNCQGYGHHTKLCKAEKPTCAICAQPHSTKDHLCTIPTCRAGNACTHPPLKCAPCGPAHKATDPLCPIRIRLIAESQNKAPAPEQDESIEQQLWVHACAGLNTTCPFPSDSCLSLFSLCLLVCLFIFVEDWLRVSLFCFVLFLCRWECLGHSRTSCT